MSAGKDCKVGPTMRYPSLRVSTFLSNESFALFPVQVPAPGRYMLVFAMYAYLVSSIAG